jgi:hypothetical protein
MEIWNYNSISGELTTKSLADESPLEPGVYHIPAHATTVSPPNPQEGKAIVFKNDSWIYEEDHRGERWWDTNGNQIIIDRIGSSVIEGLTSVEPPPPPELSTEEKLAKAGISIDELKKLLGL